jgi:hypothetical protein
LVATESNRLPSFKNRRTLSPRENEQTERKTNPEKNLSFANSGLDIETKNFSATSQRRSFFVDIPFYRTTYQCQSETRRRIITSISSFLVANRDFELLLCYLPARFLLTSAFAAAGHDKAAFTRIDPSCKGSLSDLALEKRQTKQQPTGFYAHLYVGRFLEEVIQFVFSIDGVEAIRCDIEAYDLGAFDSVCSRKLSNGSVQLDMANIPYGVRHRAFNGYNSLAHCYATQDYAIKLRSLTPRFLLTSAFIAATVL